MIFNLEITIGNIIALCAFIGTIVMFVLTNKQRKESKGYAQNADAFNSSAKKYYDLMIEQLKAEKHISGADTAKIIMGKAYCDANIVKIGRNEWILKVYNKGNASATDVSFRFLINDAPTIIGTHDKTCLIKLLEPQRNVDYHLGIYMGLVSSSWEYEVTWTNEDGSKDSKKGVLTLPLS